ncbi:hypothetical protein LLEC1_01855 [Akanthomyces lecanii]|uniref:Uncharacterized protein n=1 Tax=Cordyceps confragosa TaxID=2714763 RepID=A0A179I4B3_CORDF|nr:hypothetical protein LLEC1_01855 [Akanthomyces lecanii]
MRNECCGLSPVPNKNIAYEKSLKIDSDSALPSCVQQIIPPYLWATRSVYYIRRALEYHFARITLHQAYMLLESITERFQTAERPALALPAPR